VIDSAQTALLFSVLLSLPEFDMDNKPAISKLIYTTLPPVDDLRASTETCNEPRYEHRYAWNVAWYEHGYEPRYKAWNVAWYAWSDYWFEDRYKTILYLLSIALNTLYKLWRFVNQLFNCLYSIFSFEWPDGHRFLSTTMPWNIPPSLVVLWGVCWMFAPYGQGVYDSTQTGEGFIDINLLLGKPYGDHSFESSRGSKLICSISIVDSYDFPLNYENSAFDNSFDCVDIPGAWSSASISNPVLQGMTT
jgi:hypothetical protein